MFRSCSDARIEFDLDRELQLLAVHCVEKSNDLQKVEQQGSDLNLKAISYSVVFANGKSKRYSTRRSAAWKAVSSKISSYQGSLYGKK